MNKKQCNNCERLLPLDRFFDDSSCRGGKKTICRECTSIKRRAYNKANGDEMRAASVNYHKANSEARGAYDKNRRGVNPEKYSCHSKVHYALRSGRLTKGNCGECGALAKDSRIQAHHEDYSKPLEVRWLCASCHMQLHARLGSDSKGEDGKG